MSRVSGEAAVQTLCGLSSSLLSSNVSAEHNLSTSFNTSNPAVCAVLGILSMYLAEMVSNLCFGVVNCFQYLSVFTYGNEVSVRLSTPSLFLRVWWRSGRMTAGTVVITGGILATVILLCIIAVLCYCRLQVSIAFIFHYRVKEPFTQNMFCSNAEGLETLFTDYQESLF